ncbi:MAG: protein-serine/threonine phosphatase [Acidobacteria bacterium]|nr:MAG: protein-serine/threonine phosphatase [Acidobacteriota bacterium]
MVIRAGVEFAHLSDIGCQREHNEDFSGYWEPEAEEQFRRKGRLAVIADGMGGYEGGEQASQIAVKTVREVYEQGSGEEPQSDLVLGLRAAHERIQEYAILNPGFLGMGTTCTAACVVKGKLYFAHVGDSRLYLIRSGSISRLTRDHSYVNRLIETGLIRAEEAEGHPQRHILTAALGVGADFTADSPVTPLALKPGDMLLLCTDGLWALVADEELRAVAGRDTAADACRELVRLAKERGAPDNVTVQLLRLAGDGAANF